MEIKKMTNVSFEKIRKPMPPADFDLKCSVDYNRTKKYKDDWEGITCLSDCYDIEYDELEEDMLV